MNREAGPRRRLAASMLVLGLAWGCAGAPDYSGPGGAVRRFYAHLNDGQYAEALALYSTDASSVFGGDLGGFRRWADGETRGRTIDELTIVREEPGETSTSIEFEIRYRDGARAARSVAVVQEGGRWRLGLVA